MSKSEREKPVVLLLTNLNNDHEEEDIYLSQCLRRDFGVIVSSPFDCEAIEDDVDLILIRNTWPNYNQKREFDEIKNRWRRKGLATYNPLTGNGDIGGKGYLIELYNAGYPVIPSVGRIEDIPKLPKTDMFFAKPLYKCDNADTFSATKSQLLSVWLEDYIIQPYINFECEISFYFIDGKFIYAFKTKRKVGMHEIEEYKPAKEDLKLAARFVEWDAIEAGLIRIDLCRTKDGKLLLVELEDFEPFLYLLRIAEATREKMVDALIRALKARLEKGSR